MESIPINGRTYIEVPGYNTKIPVGVMSSFAYPVDGSGEHWLCQNNAGNYGCQEQLSEEMSHNFTF